MQLRLGVGVGVCFILTWLLLVGSVVCCQLLMMFRQAALCGLKCWWPLRPFSYWPSSFCIRVRKAVTTQLWYVAWVFSFVSKGNSLSSHVDRAHASEEDL